MIDPATSKTESRKTRSAHRANRFVNYRPRLIRHLLLFGLRGAMKLLLDIQTVGLENVPRTGPLIVEEYDATCVIPPGARAALDAAGNIVIELDAPAG